MDEPLVRITRNFYISLAIAIVILFGGGFLSGGSETGSGVAMILAFVVGLTLLQVLDAREERCKQRNGNPPR